MAGKTFRRYLALVLALFLSVAFGGIVHLTASAPDGDPVNAVYITTLEGDVQVYRASLHRWVTAFPDMRLLAKDEVKTGPESFAEISFGTTAVVHVEENTHIMINRDVFPTVNAAAASSSALSEARPSPVLKVKVGTVFVQVAKGLARLFDFSVETPIAIAGVRGTIFLVQVNPDGSTTVAVYDGVVAVRAENREVLVQAGETTVVDPGTPPKPPLRNRPEISDERVNRWLEKRAENIKRQLDRLLREDSGPDDRSTDNAGDLPDGLGAGVDKHRERLERELEEIETALEKMGEKDDLGGLLGDDGKNGGDRSNASDHPATVNDDSKAGQPGTGELTAGITDNSQDPQDQPDKPGGQRDQSQSQQSEKKKDPPGDGKDTSIGTGLHDVEQTLNDMEQDLNDAGQDLNDAMQALGVGEGGGAGDALL